MSGNDIPRIDWGAVALVLVGVSFIAFFLYVLSVIGP